MSEFEEESENDIWAEIENSNPIERGWHLLKLCASAYNTNRFTQALTLAESSRDAFHTSDEQLGLANAEMYRAMCLDSVRKVDNAKESLRSAILIFSELDHQEQWNCRKMLARWLHRDGELGEALDLVETMLIFNLYEMNLEAAATDYQSLGKISCDKDECLKAINAFEKSLNLLKSEKCVLGVGDSEILISRCYNHLKMAAAAERHARRAIAIFDCSGNLDKRAQGHCLLGRALNQQSRFSTALSELNLALDLITSVDLPDYHAIYQIQSHKVRSLEGLGNKDAADDLRLKNRVINETIRVVDEFR